MGEIRRALRAHGAGEVALVQRDASAEVAFRHGPWSVRLTVPVRPMSDDDVLALARRRKVAAAKLLAVGGVELEERRVWRVLYWLLKSRMEAIDAGVETFAEAFLPHLVDPGTDRTVYEAMVAAGAVEQLQLTAGAS
jgi:hypothetical protein